MLRTRCVLCFAVTALTSHLTLTLSLLLAAFVPLRSIIEVTFPKERGERRILCVSVTSGGGFGRNWALGLC